MTDLLEAIDLSYSVGGRSLISKISLSFATGGLYAILGPNGAGKSTFLKTVAGIWKPTSGTAMWKGVPLNQLSRREVSRIVTLVPQQYSVPFQYTVTDIVQMGRYARSDDSAIIAEALEAVDASHLSQRPFAQLSQGERQRVLIARAVATEAPVMLLDEPTNNLDLRHQVQIWALLKRLAKSGRTLVVTLHDLQAAQQHCPYAAMFHNGRCVAFGATAETLSSTLIQKVLGVRYVHANQCYELS